jgi:hypothetical protein
MEFINANDKLHEEYARPEPVPVFRNTLLLQAHRQISHKQPTTMIANISDPTSKQHAKF